MGKVRRGNGEEGLYRFGRLVQDRVHHRRLVFPAEREFSRQHLEQEDTEGEDIASRVDLAPLDLLWRHVGERTDRARRTGELEGAFQFCQAEVHHLCLAGRGEHDVVTLDVPVDNAFRVCLLQCFTDLDCDLDGVITLREGDFGAQLAAVHIFHHHKQRIADVFNAVNDADVGMIQSGCRLCLLKEACLRIRIFADAFRKELQRDSAVEFGVVGFVNDAHPALSQFLEDPIVTDNGADHDGFSMTKISPDRRTWSK